MSKSVLVLDTPEKCESCMYISTFRSFCKINCRDIKDASVKPDWCPLMDLPEKENGDYPSNTSDMLALWRAGTSVLMRLQEKTKMINLANKCVLIRTHEEYENILKAAKKQGYRWYGGKEVYPYPFEEQQIPDILKFYSNKELTRNASLTPGYELVEASDVIEDEKELKDAISLVRTFAEYPDRTALTDSFIKSLKLLADTVESQMEEVK